ncbi:phage portal protein [Sphingomonadaceae bacterium G21617-S1]|nr:phage portal protein [Sphingomonadaceae bacterium G21617-S1]
MKDGTILDRAIARVSPSWALERQKARFALDRLSGVRAEYDGATKGRRAAGWRRKVKDANGELTPRVLALLRGIAHDLTRNNGHAARGAAALAEHIVGTGITFQVYRNGKQDMKLTQLARDHFDSTTCDAAGRHDLYGLQLQAAKSIVTGGAGLMRRRWRRVSDGLPVPFQIQLLEPDYIDLGRQGALGGENAGYLINGIQFDPLGRREGYWLYSSHPGSVRPGALGSKFVAARDVAHIFRADRPEQEHGATWFAPVILRMKDFADMEDAYLLRQKIASCFAVFKIGDPDEPDTNQETDGDDPELENIEPGMIYDLPDGKDIKFASPPAVDGYADYSKVSLHAVSAGLGVPYEVITGDLSNVSFISGRLGLLNFRRSVATWQWHMFVPQFCKTVEQWFFEAAEMAGHNVKGASMRWTPPTTQMLDPATEIIANRDAVRSGQATISSLARERGEDPDTFLEEWSADAQRLDALGLIFDSDPRRVTAVGNPAPQAAPNKDNRS